MQLRINNSHCHMRDRSLCSSRMRRNYLILLALAPVLPVPADSQSTAKTQTTSSPVVLLISDSALVGGADAVLIRDPALQPSDYIIVHSSASTSSRIGSAVHFANKLRAVRNGDESARRVFRVPPHEKPWARQSESDEWRALLNRRQPKEIRGIGFGRSITLFLPRPGATTNNP
jgi:hypothetical protein